MPYSCIRLAWIVSPLTRRCWNFAPGSTLRYINHNLTSPHIQAFQTQLFSGVASRTARVSQSVEEPPPVDSTKRGYTASQIARAASQAVRVSIRERKLRDAFYIVNSTLQSPLDPGIAPPTVSRRLLNPMDFRQGVPARLVVHTLIHALLHEGHTIRAGREIQKMIAMGIRFRSRTIEASVGLLCSGPSTPLREQSRFADTYERSKEPENDWRASHILHAESMRLIPETHLALDLLSAARQSRHRRTERMYGWVVDACLLQGEIFVATLLFVVLVKDWQLRKVLKSSAVEPEQCVDNVGDDHVFRHTPGFLIRDLRMRELARKVGLHDHDLTIPYPEKTILQRILDSIDRRLFSVDSRTTTDPGVECKKPLTFLASLIDRRSIPFGQLAPLLRALYSFPRSRNKVHLLEDGRDSHVNAYDYSHQVLLRLCQSLPLQRAKPSATYPEMLPPLDTRAYNTLIHYALRHRLSPPLADAIVEHMTVYRKPPLQPDITTYNILLSSASTLRRGEFADHVLSTLHKQTGNKDQSTTKPQLFRNTPPLSSDVISTRGGNIGATEQPIKIQMPSPVAGQYARLSQIHPDAYTLCTYITHLVRTGRPEVIADIIFYILPELHIIDHPASESPSAYEFTGTREELRASRLRGIQRAMVYGPYVFSALLNALQKAGKTGLAERVWLLARQAERASWIQPESADALAPWCLPIEAYTSMMQCYANESKRGAVLIRGSRYSNQLSSSFYVTQARQQGWEPKKTGRIYVRGWAYFFLKMQARKRDIHSVQPPLRWETARSVGHLLLKSMETGALSVWQSLMKMQPNNARHFSPRWTSLLHSLKFPVTDARFFNAVLSIFGRQHSMQSRRVRASPSWWSRKLRIAHRIFRESGRTPMIYDHVLVDIARAMAHAGYTLPLGLRRAIVGRISFSVPTVERQEINIRPFAFPRPRNSRSQLCSLNVTKSRGLPLGRRKPEEMRMNRVRERRRRGRLFGRE